jgi:hypothetical protein
MYGQVRAIPRLWRVLGEELLGVIASLNRVVPVTGDAQESGGPFAIRRFGEDRPGRL